MCLGIRSKTVFGAAGIPSARMLLIRTSARGAAGSCKPIIPLRNVPLPNGLPHHAVTAQVVGAAAVVAGAADGVK